MFEVILKRNNECLECVSPVIHFSENRAAIMTFILNYNSKHFNKIEKFKDEIQVVQDDDVVFEGRVLDLRKQMNAGGRFSNVIIVEGYLNYLVDTRVGVWQVHPSELPQDSPSYAEANYDTKKFLQKVLDNHNSKVEEKKRIYLGNVTLIEPIYCMTNRETSLNAIYEKLINRKGGFLNLRKDNNKFYLDYLKDNPINSTEKIEVGINLKDINIEDSLKSLCTRLIGVGNNGAIISIAEDSKLIEEYGVIEQVCEWKDVTIQENLDRKVKEKLKEINKNIPNIKINALDLSYIDSSFNKLRISQLIQVSCDSLNYLNNHRVVAIDLNLEQPWNSTFELNNTGTTQSGITNSIIQENNDNRLEILQINGKLIQKVSSSDFETYREQTDKSIQERVKGSEFESFKIQNSKYIGEQVKSVNDNLSTLREQTEKDLSQTVKEKDFKTKFIQNIEGFDFVIGDRTPLSIRKDKLTMQFDDGTICSMGKDGFYYKEGSSNYAYKSMVARGSVSKIKSGDTVRINLPANFKGKNYEIAWWTGNIFPEKSTDLLFSANTEMLKQNKAEGWFELTANMLVRDPKTEGSPYKRGCLNAVWLAIA